MRDFTKFELHMLKVRQNFATFEVLSKQFVTLYPLVKLMNRWFSEDHSVYLASEI